MNRQIKQPHRTATRYRTSLSLLLMYCVVCLLLPQVEPARRLPVCALLAHRGAVAQPQPTARSRGTLTRISHRSREKTDPQHPQHTQDNPAACATPPYTTPSYAPLTTKQRRSSE